MENELSKSVEKYVSDVLSGKVQSEIVTTIADSVIRNEVGRVLETIQDKAVLKAVEYALSKKLDNGMTLGKYCRKIAKETVDNLDIGKIIHEAISDAINDKIMWD